MSKFANVVTIEVASGRRDQVVTLLLAHKARLKDEPGTLQFEVLLPEIQTPSGRRQLALVGHRAIRTAALHAQDAARLRRACRQI